MKIKTSELIGRPLDYAVAIAMGGTDLQFDTVETWWITIDGKDRALSRGWSAAQNFSPSTDWAQGGPIIDQLKGTMWSTNASWWGYRAPYNYANDKEGPTTEGPTLLIAAMRCYVASKLGEKVDIPDELVAATRSAA